MPGIGNQPLEPTAGRRHQGLRPDHRPDQAPDRCPQGPVDALGFNGTWPGPRLHVVEGDKVRAIFTNNLAESTGIHFHGQRLPNAMDGVPHITQAPIEPGGASPTSSWPSRPARTCTTRITTPPTRWVAACSVRSSSSRRTRRALRPALRRDPGHRLDQQRRARRLHHQRPRLPGHGADRRQARRDDRRSGS